MLRSVFFAMAALVAFVVGLVGAGCEEREASSFAPAVKAVTVEEAASAVAGGGVAVIDARGPSSYAQGHLPGARQLGIGEVSEATLGKDKEAKLLFYCTNRNCGAAASAARRASKLGYRNVMMMPEGFDVWRREGHAVQEPKAEDS